MMWHSRVIGTFIAGLALCGFIGNSGALAAYSASPEQVAGPSVEASGSSGSILLAESKKSKKSTPKPEKKEKKEEEGFLSKTFKSLIGSDDDKKKKKKKKKINPLDVAPTVSATEDKTKKEDQAKNVKTETKKTLKDSFDQIIGVDDKGKPTRKVTAPDPKAKTTKEANKEDSGGLLDSLLGSGDKKDEQKKAAEKKQAKVEEKKKKVSKLKSRIPSKMKTTASQDTTTAGKKGESKEADQLEKDRGGTKKGKNVLKESFKTLLKDEKKSKDEEKK